MEPYPKLGDPGFPPRNDGGRTEGGRWNGFLGRLLLLAGFLWAAWLDPWSLRQSDPATLTGSPQMAARQAQAVVLGMAFLQLIVAGAVAGDKRAWERQAVSGCTGLGALLYTAGYTLAPAWSPSVWLIPAGALLNLAGFALLLVRLGRGDRPWIGWLVFPVICLGMLLDVVMGLFAANPGHFLPAYLGSEDGVRLRMLRLARAAAIALPVVALFYEGLACRADLHRSLARWGRTALWCGVAGMSAVLAVAAFTSVRVKYLLPLPALTTFAGACIGVVLAHRHARSLEVWGWLLIAASMAVGLCMGLYAFDGPLPAPDFLRGYNDFARRLSRLGHAYCIVLGLLSIFIARESDTSQAALRTRRLGIPLLVAGSILTIIAIFLVAVSVLPPPALAAGPALVAVALILCLAPYKPTA
jgi:hypothetical protein